MTITELCQYFNISSHTVHTWVKRKLIPPPIGRTRNARYGLAHLEAIQDLLDIKHNNVSITAVAAHCQETGETLREYLTRREESRRLFGLGVA